ncbi:MAG: tRNA (N(6)-L-threonylcarbamoyladenosine(37)-C(2))-methylthiotransferase MtaB [Candidatus Eiseniibacteriota bacterium]|nr:MAG: tRNA (N(6)-L-threonylcarbamoyladenosine(37)-C(2))-methylthiotransferase MtaB [Candidatus Eisenbacteria bacterium]
MRRVLVRTFGCKLNQYESQFIAESFASAGHRLVADESLADIHVLNTCSVTARGDSEARKFIRRAARTSPGTLIVVTGCYAQRAPWEVAGIEGVGLVAGNAEKSRLPRLVESLAEERAKVVHVDGTGSASGPLRCGPEFQKRSRALVRIQDGCDGACSYCVVPSVRGGSRSVPGRQILEEVVELQARGFREVVLTGARIGSYGQDLEGKYSLESLLRALLAATGELRLRLSSIEPPELGAQLLELVAGEERVCSHFHVPLQSGDREVLGAMRRVYSPAEYAERVRAVKSACPDACIGADVMAGFPGEDEIAFLRTCELIEALPLSYLHVFPFSRRPGTDACSMNGQLAESVKKGRAAILRELGAAKRREFEESQLGTVRVAILESEAGDGNFVASTENYLKVLVHEDGHSRGDKVRVRIRRLPGGELFGEAC